MSDKVLSSVRQFAERHPAFSQGCLRALIFASEARETSRGPIPGNGLAESGALVRLGRRVLIDESKFFAWLESQQGKAA